MYLRQAMGPFAQGPVALIARHTDECVFSADALGPAAALAGGDRGRLRLQLRARRRLGHQDDRRAEAPGARREGAGDHRPRRQDLDPARPRRNAAHRPQALAGAQRGRGGRSLRPRPGRRRAARGRRGAGLLGRRPRGAGQGLRPHPRRLRLAARRRQTRPADGLQRGRADRLARLRRAAGGALARAPEPRRLLQGDGRRRHQPGDRPRARGRALLDPLGARPAPLGRRRGRGHGHGRDRLPGDPRRPPRDGAALRQDLPPDRPRAPDLPARGPLGGVPRPGRRRRHLPARVGDDPGGDRADQAGGGEEGPRRRRAAGAHRPHRPRRRAPLPRPAPGDLGGRPGPEAVQGRAGRGEPAPALRDHPALGGDPQRPRHDARPRARRQRRLPVHDGRGDLRRGLRDRRLQPLRGAGQGDRESDLDDRHPRGARLRAPVLLDRGQARARRDLPDRRLRGHRDRRRRLRRPRRRQQRAGPDPRRRRGRETGEDVPLLPEGLQGRDRDRERLGQLRGLLGESPRPRAPEPDLDAPRDGPEGRPGAAQGPQRGRRRRGPPRLPDRDLLDELRLAVGARLPRLRGGGQGDQRPLHQRRGRRDPRHVRQIPQMARPAGRLGPLRRLGGDDQLLLRGRDQDRPGREARRGRPPARQEGLREGRRRP